MAALKEAHVLLTSSLNRLGRDSQRVGVVALFALLFLALIPLLFARVTTAGIAPDISAYAEAAGLTGGTIGSGIGALAQVVSVIDSVSRSAEAFEALRDGRPAPEGFNLKDLQVPAPAYRWNLAVRLYLVAAFLSLITALLAVTFVFALIVQYINKPAERKLIRGHLADIDLLLSLEKSSSS